MAALFVSSSALPQGSHHVLSKCLLIKMLELVYQLWEPLGLLEISAQVWLTLALLVQKALLLACEIALGLLPLAHGLLVHLQIRLRRGDVGLSVLQRLPYFRYPGLWL